MNQSNFFKTIILLLMVYTQYTYVITSNITNSITSATYGGKDVTNILKEYINRQPQFFFFKGGPDSMNRIFGDPTPNKAKQLIINFTSSKGTQEKKVIEENQPFATDTNNSITSATYGGKDVTNILKEYIKSRPQPFIFKGEPGLMNQIFGGDPALGKVKQLIIDFTSANGAHGKKVIEENQSFALEATPTGLSIENITSDFVNTAKNITGNATNAAVNAVKNVTNTIAGWFH
jgi:hypothetical protein